MSPRAAATSDVTPAPLLARVVEQYHQTFCTRREGQAYLATRGLTDPTLLKTFHVGYADGSLLKRLPRSGAIREQLRGLGVITAEGRELLSGCVVVPIPDPTTGTWTTLYGRGVRTVRHCYLPGPLRGVLNYQAARAHDTVILTESVLDALSFLQAGITSAIPIYGTNGFTADHLDLLTRERVTRVILALDRDAAGERATAALRERLTTTGLAVCVLTYPAPHKDANDLLVASNGNAAGILARCIAEAEPRGSIEAVPPVDAARSAGSSEAGVLTLTRDDRRYHARVQSLLLGRLRVTVRVTRGERFHVDTIDLYASRSRSEFARRAAKILAVEGPASPACGDAARAPGRRAALCFPPSVSRAGSPCRHRRPDHRVCA